MAEVTRLLMYLAPHYTNVPGPAVVRPEELAEAKRLYPRARFVRETTVTLVRVSPA